MSTGSTYLVTGGSGFLGKRLVKTLLAKYADTEIRVLSRSENEIAELLTACSGDKRIVPIIGDVRDSDVTRYALHGIGTVFHLAAMKHIDLCEVNVTEAVSTNVIATAELLNSFQGNTFVSMSTDKVAGAIGCYGATKLLLEKLTLEKARQRPDSRYIVVRSGNIFGSTGSVVPKWIYQIRRYNRITVTDPDMTRFFINADMLATFLTTTAETGETGKVYVPNQEVVRLTDLARALVDTFGDANTKVEVQGRRDNEKLHERLFFASEKDIVSDEEFETSESKASKDSAFLSVSEIRSWLMEYATEYALV